jgi:hypothetical protein
MQAVTALARGNHLKLKEVDRSIAISATSRNRSNQDRASESLQARLGVATMAMKGNSDNSGLL